MITYCPRCGTSYDENVGGELIDASLRCVECALTVTEPPAMLAPGNTEEEVEYDLAEWKVSERSSASAALLEVDIPYRWEAALVLVVPAVAEDEVDLLLDELDQVDELAEAAPGAAGDEAEEADGGEEAQAAMADLFVAADRLQHAPDDAGIGSEVTVAASTVRASAPPYGIDRPTWRQIQNLATAVVADLEEGAADELVVSDAQAVRDFLRDFV